MLPLVSRLVLASGSPRRQELLARLGIGFSVVVPDVDETPHPDEAPATMVRRLATDKAAAVAAISDGAVVIGADTTVALDGEIFGKPVDDDDARRMLRRLSGRAHHVHTGVVVRADDREVTEVVTTAVVIAPLGASTIEWYLATGEPFDKAGAYAIQGHGALFVEGVRGSVSNVVGLPLTTVVRLLDDITGRSPFDR